MANRATTVRGNTKGITALGRKVTKFTRLETFPKPEGLKHVTLITSEVTSLCPVTAASDYYSVRIDYNPDKLAVESKTCKMYLGTFRNKGIFCEAFACEIAQVFADALKVKVRCEVTQVARGGISIIATGERIPGKVQPL